MIYEQEMKTAWLPSLNEAEGHRVLMKGGTDYGIFILDARATVVAWGASAERLFQYRPDEILGQHFSRLFFRSEEVYRGEPEYELRTAELNGRACADRWYVRKDGTALWCYGLTAPLDGPARFGRFFVKVLRDATEAKRANPGGLDPGDLAEGFEQILSIVGCGGTSGDGFGAQSPAPVTGFAPPFVRLGSWQHRN
jgi:PAS domain S-box-containing protein